MFSRTVALSFLLLSGISLMGAGPAQADCNDPFGKPNEVLDFHVRIKRTDWDQLRALVIPPDDCVMNYPNYQAEFRCGDTDPWMKVALKKKRGADAPPQKPSLKIDFNDDFMGLVPEAKGQSWPAGMGKLGYRKLTLNNGQSNVPAYPLGPFMLPVLLKEEVGLRLLRREMPLSPGVAFAKVYIHPDGAAVGEYHGVFVLVEDIDRPALRRRVGSYYSDGAMTKQTNAVCAAQSEFDDVVANPSRQAFEDWMQKDPAAYPGKWLAETDKAMDLDTLLRQEAAREIFMNGSDTILNNTNNKPPNPGLGNNYFAFDPLVGSSRLYIPWDVDGAFGHMYDMCAPNFYKCLPTLKLLSQCDPLVVPAPTPANPMPVLPFFSVLGKRTVCQPDIQARYLATMCQLINGTFSAAEMVKVWDEADKAVRPVIPLEVTPIWAGKDPLSLTAPSSYGAEYPRIRTWIPQRVASIRAQLKTRGVVCPDACTAGATEKCSLFDCQGQRSCSNGLWTACTLPSSCTYMSMSSKADGGAGSDAAVVRDGGAGSGVVPGRDGAVATGGTGGTSGAGGMSGTTTTPGRSDAAAAPGTDDTDPAGTTSTSRGGSGCAVAAHGTSSASGLGLLVALLLLGRRRRRLVGRK